MKAQIDKYVSENYEELLEIVKRKLNYFKSTVCPHSLIAEAYLYVVENNPKNANNIPAFIVHYINIELKYPNSNTNRREILRSMEIVDYLDDSSEDSNLNWDMFIDGFVKKLDRVDQIVWRVMVDDGLTKVRELSEHFNIPESTIYLYRVRILNKFKEHYIENYED